MNGARIGITATRRASEQAALVRSLGGIPEIGRSIDIDSPASDDVLSQTLDQLLAAPIDITVFVTGVGARHLLEAARRRGDLERVLEAVRGSRVISRGIKPRRILRTFGLAPDWVASPAESRVIRDALLTEDLSERRIVVQCAGAAPDVMIGPFRAAGADVVEAHPYLLDTPADAGGALLLADDAAAGRLDALTFTSAHAVEGFVAMAERAGIDTDAIGANGTLIVAVGPVTREALRAHGLPVHVEPAVPRMGAMFQDLAATLRARRST